MVGAPDGQVAREVLWIVRLLGGEAQRAVLQAVDGERDRRLTGRAGLLRQRSGLVPSCGADGSQPMRSARTLKSIRLPPKRDLSASGDGSSSVPTVS